MLTIPTGSGFQSTTPSQMIKPPVLEETKIQKEEEIQEEKIDIINSLSPEIILNIFSNLNHEQLVKCGRLCKNFHKITGDQSLWKSLKPKIIDFNKEDFKRYCGDIEDSAVLPLPKNIYKLLKKSCPFFPEQMIAKNWQLVFYPKLIDDDLSCIFDNFIQNSEREGHVYDWIKSDAIEKSAQKLAQWSWLLIPEAIAKEKDKAYANLLALAEEFKKEEGINHAVSKPITIRFPGFEIILVFITPSFSIGFTALRKYPLQKIERNEE